VGKAMRWIDKVPVPERLLPACPSLSGKLNIQSLIFSFTE
jgi:hypothetical protein